MITSGRDRGAPLPGVRSRSIAQGNIDVGDGPSGGAVWQVAPDGIAHLDSGAVCGLGGNGGAPPTLQPGPAGAIYAACPDIFRVDAHKLVSIAALNRPLSRPLHGQAFLPRYFAFAPNGTLYADEEPGGTAFEAHQQLRSVATGRVSLLWQQTNHIPR